MKQQVDRYVDIIQRSGRTATAQVNMWGNIVKVRRGTGRTQPCLPLTLA